MLMARVLTMDWAGVVGVVGVVPVACWRGVREKERWFRGTRPPVKEAAGCLAEWWVLEIGMGSERRVVEGERFELPFEVADWGIALMPGIGV